MTNPIAVDSGQQQQQPPPQETGGETAANESQTVPARNIFDQAQYQLDLQLYVLAPEQIEQLDNLETLARQRIAFLKALEAASMKGLRIYSSDWFKQLLHSVKKANLSMYYKMCTSAGNGQTKADYDRRRADHIAHFLLRLIYCDNEELTAWFIDREIEFLRLRFVACSNETRRQFLKAYGFTFESVSNDEKACLKDAILESTGTLPTTLATAAAAGTATAAATTTASGSSTNVVNALKNFQLYKVPFQLVNELVEHRRVYLQNGLAFVPEEELITAILPQYKVFLKENMPLMSSMLLDDSEPSIGNDPGTINLMHRLRRLIPMTSIRSEYAAARKYSQKSGTADTIELAELNKIARQSFPLCMRSLHDWFRNKHHLKHYARLQYSYFLKGIGLSVDQVTNLWRDEFCKRIDLAEFNKKYVYGIQHAYGLVGRRREARPYDCRQIIARPLAFEDCHGCPYKHWDADHLRKQLYQYGLTGGVVHEIVDLSAAEQYHVACAKYFQATHQNREPDDVIVHPNQYFEYSRKLVKAGGTAAAAAAGGGGTSGQQ